MRGSSKLFGVFSWFAHLAGFESIRKKEGSSEWIVIHKKSIDGNDVYTDLSEIGFMKESDGGFLYSAEDTYKAVTLLDQSSMHPMLVASDEEVEEEVR